MAESGTGDRPTMAPRVATYMRPEPGVPLRLPDDVGYSTGVRLVMSDGSRRQVLSYWDYSGPRRTSNAGSTRKSSPAVKTTVRETMYLFRLDPATGGTVMDLIDPPDGVEAVEIEIVTRAERAAMELARDRAYEVRAEKMWLRAKKQLSKLLGTEGMHSGSVP